MNGNTGNPISSPVEDYLNELLETFRSVDDGAVADYIPELAKAGRGLFGIAIATTDGRIYEVGDSRHPFTIQSISKPLVYGLALEDNGVPAVLEKIGVEPTGDAFNSISLEPQTGRPFNPMINAGAIAATALAVGRAPAEAEQRLLALFSMYAGRTLEVDEDVFESELRTGHRNRAIGHMLRNFDILTEDPEPALRLYFRQCSISVDCRDLAMMAATLAGGGVQPATGERVVPTRLVENILSVMTTCGMYDYAGEWVYRIGMPAKSGVAGGILAVLPGELGIGVYSPPLDPRGNSVRGVKVCEKLSRDLELHFLRPPRASLSAVRAWYSLASVRSKRIRGAAEHDVLRERGSRVLVYELQGDLDFAAAEMGISRVVERSGSLDAVIFDLKRVRTIEDVAANLFGQLLERLARDGRHLVFTSIAEHPRLLRNLEEKRVADETVRVVTFTELDAGLEWAETLLLAQAGLPNGPSDPVMLAEHEVCDGMSEAEIAQLAALVENEGFRSGQLVVRKGDAADRLYILLRGQVSVTVDLANGQQKRLSTLSAGMAFGEIALVEDAVRTADVRADEPVECATLSRETFLSLDGDHEQLKIAVLRNLLRTAAHTAGRLTQEVMALER